MSSAVDALVLDLLEWLDSGPRPYVEVIDVWRTSCPRLPVWEEANDRGFVARREGPSGSMIYVTERGSAYLSERGRV